MGGGLPALIVGSTRWTITLAGALPREAGATVALPLVAHLKPQAPPQIQRWLARGVEGAKVEGLTTR